MNDFKKTMHEAQSKASDEFVEQRVAHMLWERFRGSLHERAILIHNDLQSEVDDEWMPSIDGVQDIIRRVSIYVLLSRGSHGVDDIHLFDSEEDIDSLDIHIIEEQKPKRKRPPHPADGISLHGNDC